MRTISKATIYIVFASACIGMESQNISDSISVDQTIAFSPNVNYLSISEDYFIG